MVNSDQLKGLGDIGVANFHGIKEDCPPTNQLYLPLVEQLTCFFTAN